jgi:hypothetical protein
MKTNYGKHTMQKKKKSYEYSTARCHMYNFDVKNRLTVFSVKNIAKENPGSINKIIQHTVPIHGATEQGIYD